MTNPKTVPATPAPRASRAKPAQVAAPGAVVKEKTSMTAWIALAAVVMIAIIYAAWKVGPIGSDNPALGSSEPSKAVATSPTSQPTVIAPVDHVAKASAVATVVCDKDNTQTAKAIGKTASAVATCGNTKSAVKVAKAPAKASVAHAAPAANGLSAEAILQLANENIALRLAAAGMKNIAAAATSVQGTSSTPRFLEEGKVYSDADGNTMERINAGSRECRFYVNGNYMKSQFVQNPDKKESKKQCDLLSAQYLASLTPTTPENGLNLATPDAQVPKATVLPKVAESTGNVTCELTYDGKLVETMTAKSDEACKALVAAKAKAKGWIPK
jgi:hypothetical protein